MNNQTLNMLDVTKLPPSMKHPTIFEWFDELEPGDAFVINNDHDPRPLYYQLLAERGNIFAWEYLESGPEIWQVKISRNPGEKETIGTIAASDARKMEVFRKYGIDFCCGGKKTVREVCQDKGINENILRKDLNEKFSETSGSPRFIDWSPAFLVDYIVQNHHGYIRKVAPELKQFLHKVANVHGDKSPHLFKIKEIFGNLAKDLFSHMEKEEQILFPFIKELENGNPGEAPFGTVDNPIKMLEDEHEEAGKMLGELTLLTDGYTPPDHACNSYRYAYHLLQEFEKDLHQHIHLENNVLFPKVKKLQK